MKPRSMLVTAIALTLPAWTLSAQENQPPRPPETPRPEGGPRPPAPLRPEGHGEHRKGGQRPMPGLFDALDANHDGAVDAQEISQAAEVLRKMDRNGDGRLGADEFRGSREGAPPPRREGAEPRRPQADQQPGKPPGDGDRKARPEGERREQRGPEARQEGHGKPPGDHARREGDRDRKPEARGPQREEHGKRDQCPQCGGPAGAPPQARQGGPQMGGQRPGPQPPPQGGDRPGHRPPWEGKVQAFDRGHQGHYAMGPQRDGFRPNPPHQGSQDIRKDQRGSSPQNFNREMRPPQGGPDRGPGAGQRHGLPPKQPPQAGPGPRHHEQGQRPPQMQPRHDDRGPAARGPQQDRAPHGPQGSGHDQRQNRPEEGKRPMPPHGSDGGRPDGPTEGTV